MIEKTGGIVLHTVRYGESSLIATVYTEQFGRQSYIINAARDTRSKKKVVFMQPLFILDMEVYFKPGREIQRVKEIRLAYPYLSVPFDIRKSAQTVFLAEVLYKILQEEEKNEGLYQFLESSLKNFDSLDKGAVNFQIWFLSHLSGFLGIRPLEEETGGTWFDLEKGMLVDRLPLHNHFMESEITGIFRKLLVMNINELPGISIGRDYRMQLLIKQLEYLNLHFAGFGNIRSLDVLKQVFE